MRETKNIFVVQDIVSIIGSLGILSIYFLLTYNAGYFAALGVEYLHFFSLSDLIISALFIMPIAVVTITLSVFCFCIFHFAVLRGLLTTRKAFLLSMLIFVALVWRLRSLLKTGK